MGKMKMNFQKTLAFDEYAAVLKSYLYIKQIPHISGLCAGGLLSRNLTEKEIEEIALRAKKNHLFEQVGDEIHISHEMMMFCSLAVNAKTVTAIHKPSFGDTRLITVFQDAGMYGAVIQDAAHNRISLFADRNLDLIYSQIEKEIHRKDINKDFSVKRQQKLIKEKKLANGFCIKQEFQLSVAVMDNRKGNLLNTWTYNVGKTEYECLEGDLEHGTMSTGSCEKLDETLKALLEKHCISGEKQKREDSYLSEQKDVEPYTRLSYQKLTSDPNFPKGTAALLAVFGRNLFQTIKSKFEWKPLMIRLVLSLLLAGLTVFVNMYAMCYLNDTFRLDYNAFLGSATPYLFVGSISRNSALKGLSVLNLNGDTRFLVLPLYLLLSFLVTSMIQVLLSGRGKESLKNFTQFPIKWKLYSKNATKKFKYYLWTSILAAGPVSLILFNPFTVVVLAVILLLSAIKGDNSLLGGIIMITKSAVSYKKVQIGKKDMPRYADVMLRISAFGAALLLYSGLNLLVWHLFQFQFWSRVIFTVVLMVLGLFQLGILKIEKGNKIAVLFLFAAVGSVLILLAGGDLISLADDGGWSESGRNLIGLMNNSGFGTIMAFSLLMGAAVLVGALTIFGATMAVAATVGALTAAGAAVWSSTTQTGRETAYDFIQGKYSPYGGDSLIATGLDIAIGFVPFVGNAWQVVSCTRDATYDFSNGNYLEGTVELVFAGLGAKGFADELSSLNKLPQNIATDSQMNSSYDERIKNTPKGKWQNESGVWEGDLSDNCTGTWTGKRGESTFIPSNQDKVGKYLDDAGVDGINYVNGQPDFSPVSKGNVNIDNMSTNRLGSSGNYSQADEALAKIRGNGTTAEDVRQWRKANNYTWHECNNMTTMQKVPTTVNSTFQHLGGVSEIRHAENAGEVIQNIVTNSNQSNVYTESHMINTLEELLSLFDD
ncbi:MAG: HNH endonuclease [Lachnospiraceae bacterium]